MKSSDISIARIIRPRFADIYQRKKLFKLLDKSRGHPLLWITGPPGYGKTILVSSYIESRKLSCLWYQADAGDGDIATFFYYMGLAARKASPLVWAWGANYYGQLGDGAWIIRLTPVQVIGLSNVVAIAAGEYHSLAVKGDGSVWAWGLCLP